MTSPRGEGLGNDNCMFVPDTDTDTGDTGTDRAILFSQKKKKKSTALKGWVPAGSCEELRVASTKK